MKATLNYNKEIEDTHNIYIICVSDIQERIQVKLGYSDSIKNRLATYHQHNPLVRVLKTFKSTKKFEKEFHKMFKAEYYNEWYNEDILDLMLYFSEGNSIDNIETDLNSRIIDYKDLKTTRGKNNLSRYKKLLTLLPTFKNK